jgi:hypothetical protein
VETQIMEAKLNQRLAELNAELECGQRMMVELESRQLRLRESMLRIGGAIQVLQEILGKRQADESAAAQVTSATAA